MLQTLLYNALGVIDWLLYWRHVLTQHLPLTFQVRCKHPTWPHTLYVTTHYIQPLFPFLIILKLALLH
ncbi:hypothetical protein HanRHA438_Chr03g0113561 [Helianthus annuus]|nr:hypothetical protein HanRHA438_Chr03g0113561 [Helianthus annuus]